MQNWRQYEAHTYFGYCPDDGDVSFAGRIPLGLDFIYNPMSFYAELDPLIFVIPGTDFDIGGGIGFRFYF